MQKTLIAGNWKQNCNSASSEQLINEIAAYNTPANVELLVCPPALYLQTARQSIDKASGRDFSLQIKLGAQNCSAYPNGAYTGEIAAAMLADFKVEYVIIGHSERRQLFAETNAQISAKIVAAQQANIAPILCIGETAQQREQQQTEQVLKQQLEVVFELYQQAKLAIKPQANNRLHIAYEPVWAIGSGNSATAEQVKTTHAFIRQQLVAHFGQIAAKIRILYGGSMNAQNAQQLLALPNVNGGLIGGAALNSADFLAIAALAEDKL